MDISPGTELVWNLAAQEAMAARIESIAPEHFFCAILKFAELTNGELARVVMHAGMADVLASERSATQAFLQLGDIPTTRLRHALRRAMGRGHFQHEGGVVHRSDASRALFEQATANARREGAVLTCRHLLRALLENPSPTITQVMEELDLISASAQPPDETPHLSRYARRLEAGGPGGDARPTDAPQVQVVSAALQHEATSPLMLVCESGDTVTRVMPAVARELAERTFLYELDLARMYHRAGDAQRCQAEVGRVWAETSEAQNLTLFVDVTREETRSVTFLLTALVPVLELKTPRLVVAVSDDVYRSRVRLDPALASAFHVIWLHDLGDQDVPDAL